MSEDRFEQEEPKEDVEAHGHTPRSTPAPSELGDESEDVEAHGHIPLTSELKDDDGDDFELHRRKA